ncbi:hypothetical protein FSARC_14043 [Fusarium sarcochroum]|uniref:Fungal N-terminal domain-containing protein n=1 Tax=Fusarium sarcochroum TaxID=1208366 RepID=A0A8H4SX07_9HYPO|nr:hypothetical protein FSARC_14043 [Fusarium sarcochroum]
MDSFPRALSLIENSHSNFVSAIGCFIGRLYLISQPQQEFTSTAERLKACCEDLILVIENAWLRLHIGAQMIKSRLTATKAATQSLISAIDTLTFDDVSNRFDGCRSSPGPNSLVSDARSISARLSWRQRELKGQQLICAGTTDSESQIAKNTQSTPQPSVKSKSTFSLFPRAYTEWINIRLCTFQDVIPPSLVVLKITQDFKI